MEQHKSRRLVLMPSPLQGHIIPILELAGILHSKGFSIVIVHTNFNSPDSSAYPNFTFLSIPDGLSETEAADPVYLTDLINIRCATPLRECLAKLLCDGSREPVSCFISDAALHFTRAVCDGLQLPRLVLRTGGASSFVIFASFPLLREKGYLPVQDSRLEEPVPEFAPLKVKDLPKMETRDPDGFYKFVCHVVDECKASSGLIWNTFEELESSALTRLRQEFSFPIYQIGPFHKYFPTGSPASSLLIPDRNQKVNAKYASDVWKVGLQLPNVPDRGEIEKTIRKLMLGSEGKEIRDNVLNLKEKANLCMRDGGSSFCSLENLVNHILSLK
ncbi:hypothetical protein L6164_030024 [Bauhinia variegata]|uniref:Uncharacterized protein n=1 Tax=Bauhinia variegata TaxID=167791 RepID=A0ACB9LAI9_BAUVA|nr:hypothetical protein L6164_030024 [Bauhinia variegata]